MKTSVIKLKKISFRFLVELQVVLFERFFLGAGDDYAGGVQLVLDLVVDDPVGYAINGLDYIHLRTGFGTRVVDQICERDHGDCVNLLGKTPGADAPPEPERDRHSCLLGAEKERLVSTQLRHQPVPHPLVFLVDQSRVADERRIVKLFENLVGPCDCCLHF